MDFISADIETLGLIPECDVIELAMVYCKTNVPLNECSTIQFTFDKCDKPLKGELGAMVMNADIIKEIYSYEHNSHVSPKNTGCEHHRQYNRINPDKICPILREWYVYNQIPENDKLLFAGKNFANFDIKWFEKHGWNEVSLENKWSMSHRTLDPAVLYIQKGDKKPPNLKTCIERCGMNVTLPNNNYNKLHNAMYDAFAVAHLLKKRIDI